MINLMANNQAGVDQNRNRILNDMLLRKEIPTAHENKGQGDGKASILHHTDSVIIQHNMTLSDSSQARKLFVAQFSKNKPIKSDAGQQEDTIGQRRTVNSRPYGCKNAEDQAISRIKWFSHTDRLDSLCHISDSFTDHSIKSDLKVYLIQLSFVGFFTVFHLNDKHDKLTIFYRTDDPVVTDPISPEFFQRPRELFAKKPGIIGGNYLRFQVLHNLLLDGFVQLRQIFETAFLKFERPITHLLGQAWSQLHRMKSVFLLFHKPRGPLDNHCDLLKAPQWPFLPNSFYFGWSLRLNRQVVFPLSLEHGLSAFFYPFHL